MKNLGIQTGTIEVSFTNRVQGREERLSVVEDMIEEIDN